MTRSIPALAAVSLCLTAAARGQTYVWNNAAGGPWSTPANWTPAGPPSPGGSAVFNQNSSYNVSLNAPASATMLSLNQGDVTIFGNGHSLTFSSTINGGIGSGGASGTLRLNHTLFNAGALALGGNPGATGKLVLESLTTATIGTGAFFVGTNGIGTLVIQNSSQLTTTGTSILGVNAPGTGSAKLDGNGSQWTVNGTLSVGDAGSGSLEVLNGALVSAAGLEIGADSGSTGQVTLSGLNAAFTTGGTVNVGGSLPNYPAASAVMNISSAATANCNGVTNLRTTATVNLNGGTWNVNTLNTQAGATVNWTAGKVQFASAGTLTDSIVELLTGGTRLLGFGRNLAANSGTMTLNSPLSVSGGQCTVPVLDINAPLTVGAFGIVNATDTVSLAAGKVLQVDDFGSLHAGSYILNNGGLIQLNGPAAEVTGLTVNNYGIVQGTGRFIGGMNIGTGGTVRARQGDYLVVHTSGHTSLGRIELSGGVVEYTKPLSNLTNGIISGRGEFRAGTDTPGGNGLSNIGLVSLSGGFTDIRGKVNNSGTGRIIASGGAVVTLFDGLTHNGAQFKVSDGCSAVIFGLVDGTGSFTGNGTVYMEGGYSPGASPASIQLETQTVFAETNTLTIELGGTVPGSQHDKLTFQSPALTQVVWGGTLQVTLINGFTPVAGDTFDILDFDDRRAAGTFSSILLPALPGGLTWDTSQLYTTGVLTVLPPPLNYTDWAAAALGDPFARPDDDHDNDGYDNATEYALGLFPPQPGALLPHGGLFPYPDGERLRLVFTRPIDRIGLTLKVQASDDLENWTDIATSENSEPFKGPGIVSENRNHPLDQPSEVEVRDVSDTASSPRRQIRVVTEVLP